MQSNDTRSQAQPRTPNASRPCRIAIDYDATWTSDPDAFEAIACMMTRRGHRVIVVTQRATGWPEVNHLIRFEGVAAVVIAKPGESKRKACERELEAPVDIWVDDRPMSIEGPRS